MYAELAAAVIALTILAVAGGTLAARLLARASGGVVGPAADGETDSAPRERP